jgi:hypothetical protein
MLNYCNRKVSDVLKTLRVGVRTNQKKESVSKICPMKKKLSCTSPFASM